MERSDLIGTWSEGHSSLTMEFRADGSGRVQDAESTPTILFRWDFQADAGVSFEWLAAGSELRRTGPYAFIVLRSAEAESETIEFSKAVLPFGRSKFVRAG
jgi:hypothetical protein